MACQSKAVRLASEKGACMCTQGQELECAAPHARFRNKGVCGPSHGRLGSRVAELGAARVHMLVMMRATPDPPSQTRSATHCGGQATNDGAHEARLLRLRCAALDLQAAGAAAARHGKAHRLPLHRRRKTAAAAAGTVPAGRAALAHEHGDEGVGE